MANPSDALGISADFDNEGFRNAITFAMQMGLNPTVAKRPIFVKKSTERTYWKGGNQVAKESVRMDRDGRPLDPEVEVRKAADIHFKGGIDVEVAIEVDRADAEELPIGTFRPTKVIATLLDRDYQKVQDCRELIYNGDRYMFGYEPESNGLFDVGIYTMIFYAIDES